MKVYARGMLMGRIRHFIERESDEFGEWAKVCIVTSNIPVDPSSPTAVTTDVRGLPVRNVSARRVTGEENWKFTSLTPNKALQENRVEFLKSFAEKAGL